MEEKLPLLSKPLEHVLPLLPSNGLLRIGHSLQRETETDQEGEYYHVTDS